VGRNGPIDPEASCGLADMCPTHLLARLKPRIVGTPSCRTTSPRPARWHPLLYPDALCCDRVPDDHALVPNGHGGPNRFRVAKGIVPGRAEVEEIRCEEEPCSLSLHC
jgi:hypothetical protein